MDAAWFVACNLARTRGKPQPPTSQIQVDGSPANIAYVQSFLDVGTPGRPEQHIAASIWDPSEAPQ